MRTIGNGLSIACSAIFSELRVVVVAPRSSVTWTPIFARPALRKVFVAVMPVASSYLLSPSRSHATFDTEPSGSAAAALKVTLRPTRRRTGVEAIDAVGARLPTAIVCSATTEMPWASTTSRRTL